MNQEKIGKFIQECRKKKNMTQEKLAEKLGVSDRTIGNWENGRNMPDLSLFKPLCDTLGITINELLSGEEIKKEEYQDKFEENIINTIDYSTKKINISNQTFGIALIIIGALVFLTAMTTLPSDSSWGGFYSIFGIIISLFGICKLTKKYNYKKRLIIAGIYLVCSVILFLIIDYISVITLKQIPRFCTIKTADEDVYVCENPFYNVYKINRDTPNEYVIVDKKKEYTMDTVPVVPFNRTKSGIDNIIKYQNKYVGNNSNDGNLIASLPLSEYGFTFEVDSTNLGLTINYHITGWYINENNYLEKSLLYNSVSLFLLIDNLDYIKYNFSGMEYYVKRDNFENNYPHFNEINNNEISKSLFNKYVENKINDVDFVDKYFNEIMLLNDDM